MKNEEPTQMQEFAMETFFKTVEALIFFKLQI